MDDGLRDRLHGEIGSWTRRFAGQVVKNARGKWMKDMDNNTMPFHTALLPVYEENRVFSRIERSFSTSLGKLFEKCSLIIAETCCDEAKQQHEVSGFIPEYTKKEIDGIVDRLNKKQPLGRYRDQVERVVELLRTDKSAGTSITHISDLYVRRGGVETYFELKAPLPNKKQCQDMLRHSLYVHGIRGAGRPEVATYIGMAYNPFGEGNEYVHNFAKKNLDVPGQVLMGRRYWEYIGESDTYGELLRIFDQVGSEGGRRGISEAIRLGTRQTVFNP